jgi:hypothetical protein
MGCILENQQFIEKGGIVEEIIKKLKDYVELQRRLYGGSTDYLSDYENGVYSGVNDTLDDLEEILKS